MRTIAILFTLFYFLNVFAVAPYGFKGQEQSQTLYSNVLQAPNNLVTNLGGINALMETGNNNLLVNPSFEHLTFSTGWTNSAGTFTEESVLEIHGKKAAKLVLSSQTMSLTQSSALYAAQFADGVQGLASVRVKSNVALKVCSIQAGVVSTSLCVDVQANNKWGLYKVPFILGATSNGISIASTGSVTGTVYIDDAFVGAASLTQNMNACNDVSCETEFSAKISSTGVVSDESLDFIESCSFVGFTGTCTWKTGLNTVPLNCNVTPANTCANEVRIVNPVPNGSISFVPSLNSNAAACATQIICQKQGADFTAAKQLSNGNTYSSTNADTDWASCGHTTSSFTGFGTVSAIETQCKRQGGDLLMKGKFTAGTPTAVEARISFPLWNGVQLTSAGSSVIPTIQQSGLMSVNISTTAGFANDIASLIEPSVSYFTIRTPGSSQITKALGSALTGTGGTPSFNVRIPIEGWQNSNLIIAELSGLQSCTNTLECTDTFSAKQSAGVVSQENVDWIDGSCSGSSASRTCTFKAGIFTVAPNCSVTTAVTDNVYASMTVSSTSVTVRLGATNNVTYDYAWNIICQKQGVDYVGKTAKAVASDQNMATPGVLKAVFYSAFTSGAGVISNEKGDFLNTCSCTAGTFTCSFNSNKFSSAPNCLIGNADIRDRYSHSISTSTSSLTWRLQDGVGNNYCLQQTIQCHGDAP